VSLAQRSLAHGLPLKGDPMYENLTALAKVFIMIAITGTATMQFFQWLLGG